MGSTNGQGGIELLQEDNHWIKVRDFGDRGFPGIVIRGTDQNCQTNGDGVFKRDRIEDLARLITDDMLPACRGNDIVNCHPTYQSSFPERLLTEFQDPLDGADQANYGVCPLWPAPPLNNDHCGDDLVRQLDAERDDTSVRQVYTLRGGIFMEYGPNADSTYKIRTRQSQTMVYEYQYTHVGRNPSISGGYYPRGEYIAAGVQLGNYLYTPHTALTLHVHYVIKEFSISVNSENVYELTDADGVTYISVLGNAANGAPTAEVYVPWVNNLGKGNNPRFTSRQNSTGDQIHLDVSARRRRYIDATTGNTVETRNTYTATGLPPGLNIDPATGFITGTIDASAAGISYDVTITATDDRPEPRTGVIYFTWNVGS